MIANQEELVNMLEGRAAAKRDLQRDLQRARLEKWARRNLMKFKKANAKSCPLGE